jgi:hypothetical protein
LVSNGSVTCVGTDGSFTSTFSGGSGVYSYAATDPFQSNVAQMLVGTLPGRVAVTGTTQQFTKANGSWYVGVIDSNNTTSINNTAVVINCIAPPTTTTTTTLPTYWYVMTSCTNGDTLNSIGYYGGGFSVNDIVSIGGGQYAQITQALTSAPSGSLLPITATGLTSCPTTTTTTTTAAPLPAVAFTYSTSCAGGVGTGVITITSITGGTGTGYQYSIQPTPGIWYNYPATNQLTGLANSTYSVAVRDSVGAGTSQFVGISCVDPTTTTTTTATPTTTTTTTPIPIYYYLVYDVNVCTPINPVAYQSTSSYSVNVYVTVNGSSTLKYIETNNSSTPGTVINSIAPASCAVPTTTTSTTATPTTTTTTTVPSSLTEFAISDTSYGSDTAACGDTPPYAQAWSTGSTSPPVFGDTIYGDAGGTVLLNSGYYLVPDSFPAPAWIRLGGSSQVIDNGLC